MPPVDIVCVPELATNAIVPEPGDNVPLLVKLPETFNKEAAFVKFNEPLLVKLPETFNKEAAFVIYKNDELLMVMFAQDAVPIAISGAEVTFGITTSVDEEGMLPLAQF